MGKRIHPRICGNCQFFEEFYTAYSDEDGEVGTCKCHNGDVVYLDDDSYCRGYKSLKRPRVRAEDWYE